MTTLEEFFQEQEIITEHGIYKYKDKRKRTKLHEDYNYPIQTPHIIEDICWIVNFLRHNGVSITSVSSPVLVAIIQQYLGYSRTWSYVIVSAIIRLIVILV